MIFADKALTTMHLHYYAPKISYKAMNELLFFFIPRPTLLKVKILLLVVHELILVLLA